MLGSTKNNEGETDVFKDKSHLFLTLLMELIYKVHLKFIILIMNFLSILIIMIAGAIHEGAIISTCNTIK